MNLTQRYSNPWHSTPPEGAPVQSWVVVALGPDADAFLDALFRQAEAGMGQQVVVVCCADSSHIASMPRWVTVVSVSDPAATSPEEARRVGLAQAVGDVVYFVHPDDLRTADRGPGSPHWGKELLAAGVGRPERPAGPRP